jgi:ATP-dependent Lon protease
MTQREKAWTLPVLPLRNTVLFPYALLPLSVGRERSVAAVEAAVAKTDNELVLVAQRDGSQDEPRWEDLYRVGTRAVLRKVARHPERTLEVLVQGLERVQIVEEVKEDRFFRARVRAFPLPADETVETEALRREVLDLARKALSFINAEAASGITALFQGAAEPGRLAYGLASMLNLEPAQEQALLEARTFGEALRLLHEYLSREVQILQVRHEIARHAQTEINREQREYLLRQQLKAIREELGEKSPEEAELALLRERLAKAELPEEARREVERELSRLERLPAAAAEHHVIRSYLDFVLDLPWNRRSESRIDLAVARQVLDEDHFDLKDVKDRILEHLAVLRLNPGARAPILCFVGPPGVGKTSLGQSIARALGRAFERTSLGGLHDEAELRGHRRTYIGAMPGRILQALRRAGVRNPVLMLDEVDKIGQDFRGDPAAALLEILDPAQNAAFRDNYLDLPFDLSQVFFITTANRTDTIPAPLLDRMEVLRLAGYSEEEKLQIARRYLVPRQVREAGLPPERLNLTDEALRYVVSRYTREAGVRQLERSIGRLARKIARQVVEDPSRSARPLGVAEVRELLGRESVFPEEIRKELSAGVAPGLAWTESGGEVLYVEAVRLPDRKDLLITGQVGPVMQESAQAALSFVRAHADRLGIDRSFFRNAGVHVHVPAGAIPKDGPSAGVTIAAALASLFTGRPCRSDTAMTGEITLTGLVLPVGGIKEKVLAARRAGLARVLLPRQNEPDLRDLPEEVRAGMTFVPVGRIEEVLAEALEADPAAGRAEAGRVRRGKVA